MKSIKDAIKGSFPVSPVGEKECENCGMVYKLYDTPVGVAGACKPCEDKEFMKSLNLPPREKYLKQKELTFIGSFERVTSDLKNVTVNSYKPDSQFDSQLKAKQEVIKFVKEFDGSKSLILSGNPGLGKSHLAFSTAKAIRAKGYKALYIKVTDLFDQIKSTYNHQSKITEEQIFKMLEGLDLLVLDDIGSEYVKSNEFGHETWASDILYKVFDMRLDKSNICTTNYSESELQQKYGNNGPRIISRMMNNAVGMRLEGDDYRRQEAF